MYFLVQNNHTVLPTYLKYIGTFYIQNMSHTIYKLYLHSNRLWYLPLGASICLSGSISISKHDSFDIVTSCLLVVYQTVFSSILAFVEILMALYDVVYNNTIYKQLVHIYKTFFKSIFGYALCTSLI